MKHGLPSIWDTHPDLINQLKSLYEAGYSCSKIAQKLGHGLSRSAILSKARRSGLRIPGVPRKPKLSNPSGPKNRTPSNLPKRPRSFSFYQGKQSQPSLPLFSIVALEPLGPLNDAVPFGQCKYVHGDVLIGEWRMCGADTGSIAKSFCPTHHARCYVPVSRPKQEAKAA